MVNRELSRRVKPCSSPFVWARKAVYTDLHLALRLTHALDEQRELWQYSKVQPATGEGGVVEDEVGGAMMLCRALLGRAAVVLSHCWYLTCTCIGVKCMII